MTTVRILPFLEAVEPHDGGEVCDEHLLNLRHSLQLWGASPGSMSLSAEKALGFFLSPLQGLHLCVCGRARCIKSNVCRIM